MYKYATIIHSTVDGHLGDFQLGAVLNNAAANIPVVVVWWTYVFTSLGYIYLGLVLLDHVFSLVDTAKQFSKVVVPICTFHQKCVKVPVAP